MAYIIIKNISTFIFQKIIFYQKKIMKTTENMYEEFVYFIMPFMIIFLGLIGNLLGLLTARKIEKLESKIGPINIYRYIFITDSIIILLYLNFVMDRVFSNSLLTVSIYSCKLLVYLTYTLCFLSSFLLIYILFESYLSIKYPVESNLLRNNKPQFIYFMIIFIINLIYCFPVFLYSNLIQIKSVINHTTTVSIMCTLEPSEKHKIETITLINRFILPIFLIIFFSTVLIHKICASSSRINTFYSDREREKFKKDVYLSIISILFNLIQYSFNIPIIIILFIFHDNESTIYFLGSNIFYLSYAFNFYFLLIVNSLFRENFYSIFNKNSRSNINLEMQVVLRRI
jgi:hypothetical protein